MAKKMKIMPPIHPGETLREDFLKPLGLTANKLAMELMVPVTRVNDIALGIAVMLFGTGLAFYLGKPFIQPQAPRLPAIPFGWWSSVPQVQAALQVNGLFLLGAGLAPMLAWGLTHTRWGLILQTVGDSADAAVEHRVALVDAVADGGLSLGHRDWLVHKASGDLEAVMHLSALPSDTTPDLTAKVKAGELVNHVAKQVGGKGGGRPDMAQAGGTDPSQLPAALASVPDWVGERL